VADVIVSFPTPHVLLITLNRPAQLNAIPSSQHAALEALYSWYDAEPSLRCAVLTGAGRAFCAGADLKEWDHRNSTTSGREERGSEPRPGGPAALGDGRMVGGFGGLSNRAGKKPEIINPLIL
jgi:enoyl-CoA hydratase/carnithine racemase